MSPAPLLLAAALLGCSSDPPAELTCDLGSLYEGQPSIDPDDPGDYSEEGWSNEDVIAAFEQAKADDSDAYRAYLFARDHSELLECAFCACGCSITDEGHLSASDCFKDMHGFT